MKLINNIKRIIKYKIVKVSINDKGRCITCDAGNPITLCGSKFDCPCDINHHLKLRK